jgi:phage baseplate assembly protein W
MGYQIISVTNNGVDTKVLGISYKSAAGVFKPIYTSTEQALENLKTLLLTRIGERYGAPEYGTFLLNAIFEPNIMEIKDDIKDFIVPQVSQFLPYIDIQDIDVVTAEDDPTLNHTIQITITFSVFNFGTKSLTIAANENGTITVSTP